MPPPPIQREYDPCPLSGKPIDNIYVAIADPDSGKPAIFGEVLERLKSQEELQKDQRLVYIGAGNFGIVADITKQGKQLIEVLKIIPYEDSYQKKPWRRELSPGISRDYIPTPEPLEDLYSSQELRAFPPLGAGSNIAHTP